MGKCNPGAIVVLEINLNVLHYSCVRNEAPPRLLGYLSKMDMRFKKLLPKESSRGTICRSFRATALLQPVRKACCVDTGLVVPSTSPLFMLDVVEGSVSQ